MKNSVLEKYKKAGNIASEALQRGLNDMEPGKPISTVLDNVEAFIRAKGAEPAFPAQISIDETAAHYCPVTDEETIEDGQTVKLDVGVSVDGYIADNARTKDLGENPDLVEASEEALKAAIDIIEPGVTIGEIGKTIQETIKEYGYTPVRNLTGHGLSKYNIHASPTIPNTDTGNDQTLEEGQVIAVEPFASKGAGIIYESNNPTLFTMIKKKPVRNKITRKVLKKIEDYNNLPFAKRWLVNEFGEGRTRFALKNMRQKKMLDEHPPLIDKNKGKVSQAEHTIIVKDNPILTTKR